jgi:glucose-6-phosphate isomerase
MYSKGGIIMTKVFLDIGNVLNERNEGLQQDYLARLNGRNPINVSLAAAIHCDEAFYAEVKAVAKDLQKKADALIVLGVGGVRAGAKAVVEALEPEGMELFYAGHGFSGHHLENVLKALKDREVAVIAMTKSGNTSETLLACSVVNKWMVKRYGEDAKERIVCITGSEGGRLGAFADKLGYRHMIAPDVVGGRYSLFSNVGLLQLAAAGVDIDEFLDGVREGEEDYTGFNMDNDALRYAMARNILYQQGYCNEMWVCYAPYVLSFGKWWRLLFAESECKNEAGIYPIVADNSKDLKNLQHLLSQGHIGMFETTFWLRNVSTYKVDEAAADLLGWEAGGDFTDVTRKLKEENKVHSFVNGIPQMEIQLDNLDARHLGKLCVFFIQACLLSGYMRDIDPHDQPGGVNKKHDKRKWKFQA